MIKENDKYIVVGSDYTSEGIGLAKVDGFPIFVTNLIIGEEAEIKIVDVKRHYALGKIIRFINMSPNRIKPLIAETIHLSGCQFTQLDYKKEIEFKLSRVNRALRVIGGIDYEATITHPASSPYFYRNKTVLPIARLKNGHIISGLYRYNSHQIVAFDKTHLDDEKASDVMRVIRELIEVFNYELYDEKTHNGDIRKVMIRASYYLNEIMVVIITKNENIPNIDAFCDKLVAKCPQITTIVQNINPLKTNVILGEKEKILFGKGFIQDKIFNLTFSISSKSFFQVNTKQAETLYMRAIEMADLSKDDVVLDAYSGIGTITLLAAQKAKKAIGVEIVKDAVEDAKENAKLNNIKNVEFFCDDAGDFLINYGDTHQINTVIVDPPRKGLSTVFLQKLIEVKPMKLVYVSCDPATLARDLKELVNYYEIKNIETVDMFPRTAHVETITLLSLKTA